jgi:hypothetical protein
VDRITQRLVESRLLEIRDRLERQAGGDAGPDPLEALFRRALRSQRKRIDDALERLPDGRCEQCGEAISAERLYAVPWARKCFRCQTARPQEKALLLRCGVPVPLDWD